jgi:hypothetical protein
MATTRNVVMILFLASPSDLERDARSVREQF